MHNWRLPLLAFLAVLHPIATFTGSDLVDGREQCCDRQFQDERLSYGSYRFGKALSEDRRLNHRYQIRDDRRSEVRSEDSVLSRSTADRRVEDRRLVRPDFRGISVTRQDRARQEVHRLFSRDISRHLQNQKSRFMRESAINNYARDNTVSLSRFRDSRTSPEINDGRSRTSQEIRHDTVQNRDSFNRHNENREARNLQRQIRDNVASRDFSDVRNSMVRVEENRDSVDRSKRLQRDIRATVDVSLSRLNRDTERAMERSERAASRDRTNERRFAYVRSDREVRERRDTRNRQRTTNDRQISRDDSTSRRFSRLSLENSQRSLGSLARHSSFEGEERRSYERRTVEREGDSRATRLHRSGSNDRSAEPRAFERLSRERENLNREGRRDYRFSERLSADRQSRNDVDRRIRSAERLGENDRRIVRERTQKRDLESRQEDSYRQERRYLDGRSREELRVRSQRDETDRMERREFRHVRAIRDSDSRLSRTESYDRSVARRENRAEIFNGRDRAGSESRLDLSKRTIREDALAKDNMERLERRVLENRDARRSRSLEATREARDREIAPVRIEYRITKNNLERESSRIRTYGAFTRSSLREKLQTGEQSSGTMMNWQYLFYTLQGIYLCGILMQIVSDSGSNKKSRYFPWWTGPASHLVKVD